jgi:hypothetical protein
VLGGGDAGFLRDKEGPIHDCLTWYWWILVDTYGY